jgi:hypothetical protein
MIAFRWTAKYMRVVTQPIGYNHTETMNRVKNDVNEFRKAIACVMNAALSMHDHQFVHRDIRWPNITYDPQTEKYLLIDFEQMGRLCKWDCEEHNENDFCTPAIFDAALIIRLFNIEHNFPEHKLSELEYAITSFSAKLDGFNKIKELCCETKKKRKNETKKKGTQPIDELKELFWAFYKQTSKYKLIFRLIKSIL